MKSSQVRSWKVMVIGTLLTMLMALSVAARSSAAEAWPELPLPPKASAQWIAQSMRVNGVPTRVLQFQSHSSRTEVVAYYRAHWSGGYEHAPAIHLLGDATVVGQVHGPYMLTLKVEDAANGGSTAVLAVAHVIGARVDRDAGELQLLGGGRVVSVVESDDPGKRSRQVMIIAPQAAATAAEFYRASLTNAGWQPLHANDLEQTGGPAGTLMVFAQGEREMQLQVVARKGRGSLVLANLVTKDTEPGAR